MITDFWYGDKPESPDVQTFTHNSMKVSGEDEPDSPETITKSE